MELLGPSSHDADVSASQNFLDPPGGSSLPPPSAADSSGDVAAAGASEPPSQQQYFGGVDVDLVADAELRALEAAAAAARPRGDDLAEVDAWTSAFDYAWDKKDGVTTDPTLNFSGRAAFFSLSRAARAVGVSV